MDSSSGERQLQQQPLLSSSTFDGDANFVPTKLWFNNTGTNYQAWKEQMVSLIQSQGLLGFIDGTNFPPPETVVGLPDGTAANVRNQFYDQWRTSDQIVRWWILSSLTDDVVLSVSALTTSRDIWFELENRFMCFFNFPPPINVDNGCDPQQQPMISSSTFDGSPNFVPTKLWFNNTNTNYQAWKEQMVDLIQSQGLFGFIDGTNIRPPETVISFPGSTAADFRNKFHDQWRESEMLVRGWILSSLDDDVVPSVSALTSSMDIWFELEKRFMFLNADTEPGANAGTVENIRREDLKEYLPLRRAALHGNWEAAKQIFKNDPASMTANINLLQSIALQTAVGTGKSIHFVENLVASMPDESLALMDDDGSTALSVAAAVGNIAAAAILINRMPLLLYIPNKFDNFPLQLAALYAQKDVLKYLISVTKDDWGTSPYGGLAGLRLLIFVIDAEFFDIAFELVEKYPDLALLKLPGGTSALTKIAAKKSVSYNGRRFTFWERLILSYVSVEAKAISGENVCDIESLSHNAQTVFQRLCSMPWKFVEGLGLVKNIKDRMLLKLQALKLVKCLCKKIESLSFNEARDFYFDAIMIAARLGICEIVEEIVEVFPSAIYVNINSVGSNHYIFHVAVQNRSEHVFNLVYQMSDHKHLYSDLEDSEGNNVLHLAGKLAPPHKLNDIPGAALQMQREIQWYKEVEKFVHPHARERPNYAGKSPKEVFTEEHKTLKEEGERWMKDTSNSCTIAAALIATVMFASAITVPGGNDGTNGWPILYKGPAFIVFAVSDAISLFTSATSLLMFLAILTSRYADQDFLYVLPKRLIIGLGTLFLSITFMMVAFSAALYLVFARNQAWVLIPVVGLAGLPVTSFVLLQFPLLVDLISSTYGRGIFGKQSNRPFY